MVNGSLGGGGGMSGLGRHERNGVGLGISGSGTTDGDLVY